MSQPPSPSPGGNQDEPAQQQSEHLNIKVTDNNNEVFFKIKRTTQLKKLMDAFCERQGKSFTSVRFLFDGTRVNPTDNPEMVSTLRTTTTQHMPTSEEVETNFVHSSRCRTVTPSRSTRSRLADAEASPLHTCTHHHANDRHENDYAPDAITAALGRNGKTGDTWLGDNE